METQVVDGTKFFPGPVGPVKPGSAPATRKAPDKQGKPRFGEVLQKQLSSSQDVKFSGHAQSRIQQRSIQFDQGHLNRLSSAVEQAGAKGARESLVMIDGVALIVNVPNRTVVTVMDKASMRDNIVTNIDSAIVA